MLFETGERAPPFITQTVNFLKSIVLAVPFPSGTENVAPEAAVACATSTPAGAVWFASDATR